MKFKDLRNEILEWYSDNDFAEYSDTKTKLLYKKIDMYLYDGEMWVPSDDKEFRVEDCDMYIDVCNCAIKRYPNKSIFKEHLETIKNMKQKYTLENN